MVDVDIPLTMMVVDDDDDDGGEHSVPLGDDTKDRQDMGEAMTPAEMQLFQARLDRASLADMGAWESYYKIRMGNAIAFFHTKLRESSGNWTLVPPPNPNDTVSLYKQATRGGYYVLKAVGTLNARADRVMVLNADNDWHTRKQWDSQDVSHVEQIHQFRCTEGDINVVKSTVKVPVPGVSDRFTMGVQWNSRDAKLGTHTLVFATADSFMEQCPDNMVSVENLSGVWVQELQPTYGKKKKKKKKKIHRCKCIIVAYVNPKGWIPVWVVNMFQEKLRERLHLYERVAGKDWGKYYGGKNPFCARSPQDARDLEKARAQVEEDEIKNTQNNGFIL
jgi:hypothetical protein